MRYDDANKVDDIVLVTEKAKHLNPKQEIAYRQHRKDLAEWMLNLGRNPTKAEEYSHSTAKTRMNRLDMRAGEEGFQGIDEESLPEVGEDAIQVAARRTQPRRGMGAGDRVQ